MGPRRRLGIRGDAARWRHGPAQVSPFGGVLEPRSLSLREAARESVGSTAGTANKGRIFRTVRG